MITFDLACQHRHRFEGWFRNREDFDRQIEGGLVACPLCGSTEVSKQLSAVSVHVSRRSRSPAPAANTPEAGAADAPAAPAPTAGEVSKTEPFFRALARLVETHFEDVGARFASEARKIERGEVPGRSIRGTSTAEEEEALREEGIEFLKVALPKYDA